VFEGVRPTNGDRHRIFRLKEHTDRLFASAHIYMIEIPVHARAAAGAQLEVVRRPTATACYIRPIAFYARKRWRLAIGANARRHRRLPWGAYLGRRARESIRVKTASYARHHINVTMARAKMSGTYPNSVLATLEATQHATMKACCSMSTASSPKAPARTSSW